MSSDQPHPTALPSTITVDLSTPRTLPDDPLPARPWRLPPRSVDAADPTGDYGLGRVIGQGATAIVHEAVQRALGRIVAVKHALDPRRTDHLLRETLIAAAVEHPNVLPVHEAGEDPRLGPFLAMRRPLGVAWRARMRELGLERNLEILIAVADAVACAHRHGILHRDLKPAGPQVAPDPPLVRAPGRVRCRAWTVRRHRNSRRRSPSISGCRRRRRPSQACRWRGGCPDARWARAGSRPTTDCAP